MAAGAGGELRAAHVPRAPCTLRIANALRGFSAHGVGAEPSSPAPGLRRAAGLPGVTLCLRRGERSRGAVMPVMRCLFSPG